MVSYTKVTRHGQITLPSPVRRELGIEEGDIIEITIEGDRAVLATKKLVDKGQAYFWSKEWQEAEKEADLDIKEGRVKSFELTEELFEELGKDPVSDQPGQKQVEPEARVAGAMRRVNAGHGKTLCKLAK